MKSVVASQGWTEENISAVPELLGPDGFLVSEDNLRERIERTPEIVNICLQEHGPGSPSGTPASRGGGCMNPEPEFEQDNAGASLLYVYNHILTSDSAPCY